MGKFQAPNLDEIIESAGKKKIAELSKAYREQSEKNKKEHFNKLSTIRHSYRMKPKKRATYKEIEAMILMVLETGCNGTKAIRRYSKENGKDEQWVKDIARPTAGKCFDWILKNIEENNLVIRRMISNNTYCRKDITKNSVTGALNKLSNQLKQSDEIDKGQLENERLRQRLMLRNDLSKKDKTDWVMGQKLRDQGLTVREIADILGASPSAVSKYTSLDK